MNRGAELGNTDIQLQVAHLQLKLRPNQHTKTQGHLYSSLLSDPHIATDYCSSIGFSFNSLAADKVSNWQVFNNTIIQSAHSVFGSS